MSNQQKPSADGRLFAILAYILPLIGGLIGIILNGSNPLTRNHARQSIGAVLTLVLTFVAWVVVGIVVALLPIGVFGPVVAVSLFALVIALGLYLIVNWIISLIHAAQGNERVIPISDRLTARLFREARKPKVVKAPI